MNFEILNIKIDEKYTSYVNSRIDIFLSQILNDFSRNQISKLIDEEHVKVNNKIVKSSYKLKLNDEIFIKICKEKTVEYKDISNDIKIIFQNDDYLVLNKNRGIVVHPSLGHHGDTIVDFLKRNNYRLADTGDDIRPGIVHRIDKDTSGLLLIAKTQKALTYFSSLLKNHEIKREYIAIVRGIIKENSGTIDAPIGRDEKDRKKYKVTNLNSKPAVTHFNVVERLKNHTIVKLKLETGRTHQIRVHMLFINHPIEGDELYCNNYKNFNGQLLHAYKLSFIDLNGEKVEYTSEIPEYFKKAIELLR